MRMVAFADGKAVRWTKLWIRGFTILSASAGRRKRWPLCFVCFSKDVIYFNLRLLLYYSLEYHTAVGGEGDGQRDVVFERCLELLAAQGICQYRPRLLFDSRMLEEMHGQVQRNCFLGAGEVGDDESDGPPNLL